MSALLSTTNRVADRCEQTAKVSSLEDEARLVCDLKADHPGPLHFDRVDGIWWAA